MSESVEVTVLTFRIEGVAEAAVGVAEAAVGVPNLSALFLFLSSSSTYTRKLKYIFWKIFHKQILMNELKNSLKKKSEEDWKHTTLVNDDETTAPNLSALFFKTSMSSP